VPASAARAEEHHCLKARTHGTHCLYKTSNVRAPVRAIVPYLSFCASLVTQHDSLEHGSVIAMTLKTVVRKILTELFI
jgi:hypothetical protein